MSAHAARLAHLFSPTFASSINAQIIYPVTSHVVKPNELESALARPLQKAHYEPESSAAELAASLSYGIIKGQKARFLVCILSLILSRTPIFGRQQKDWCGRNRKTRVKLEFTGFNSAFFLANEYMRAQGLPGLACGGKVGEPYGDVQELAERYIDVASGKLGVDALLAAKNKES